MKTKIVYFLLALCLSLPGVSASVKNAKPFVIPELKEWSGRAGEFTLNNQTQIRIPQGDADIKQVATAFAADIKELLNLDIEVVEGKQLIIVSIFVLKKIKN